MYLDKIYIFRCIGINYNKSDVQTRGLFVVKEKDYKALLEKSKSLPVRDIFVVSTCNRTEIYGFAESPEYLVNLLCEYTEGNKEVFLKNAYIYEGEQAVSHLFKVAAGLDSQILGDYEIQGQIKRSFQTSHDIIPISSYTEKLISNVFESAKKIKTTTQLSGGTISVSFAAVEYIIGKYKHPENLSVVLLGLGEIGKNTCKNFVTYIKSKNITIINRNNEKAEKVAQELGIHHVPFTEQFEATQKADIIIVATNAPHPTVMMHGINTQKKQCIIDLSVPSNVDTAVQKLSSIDYMDIDKLSKIIDKTLSLRQAEIPKAEIIIQTQKNIFYTWCNFRPTANRLNETKLILAAIAKNLNIQNIQEEDIKQAVNKLALKSKQQHITSADMIETIVNFIEKK